MTAAVLLWILAAVLVALGIAGLLLPALPGAPLLFAGLFAAAWAEDFRYVGLGWLSILGALALVTYAIDFAATALGAKRFGASKRAMLGAVLGGVAGIFFAPIGLVLGPFAGAVIGELTVRRDWGAAQRAGLGATLGVVLGAAVKLALAFAMLGLFASARFFGAD